MPGHRVAVLIACLAITAQLGCASNAAETEATDAGSDSEAPAAGASARGPAQPALAEAGENRPIQLEVKDFQLFHPASRNAALTSTESDLKVTFGRSRGMFGVGVVVEARNDSREVLLDPEFSGQVTFEGERVLKCEVKATNPAWGTDHLSLDPTRSERMWRNEASNDDEAFWRPGETIRFAARASCAHSIIFDMGLQRIETSFAVHAHRTKDELVTSERLSIQLPREAAILREMVVEEGWAFLAGDVVIRITSDAARTEALAKLGGRADRVNVRELPETSDPVRHQVGALSMEIAPARLLHWTETSGTAKGHRRLELPVRLAIDQGAVEDGLRAPVQSASEALETARRQVEETSKKLEELQLAAAAAPRPQAELATATDENRRAKAVETRAASQLAAAQAAFDRAKVVELARLARAIDCNGFRLVTVSRTSTPENRNDLSAACRRLASEGNLELVVEFDLGRYEVPVAVAYVSEGRRRFAPIASKTLLAFDPR
jgi:hypothetical protein